MSEDKRSLCDKIHDGVEEFVAELPRIVGETIVRTVIGEIASEEMNNFFSSDDSYSTPPSPPAPYDGSGHK
jgi:hypothetical protein